jgi:hypothetical protein
MKTNEYKMKKRRKLASVLENRPLMFSLIFIVVSLSFVIASDVVVQNGNFEVNTNVFYVNGSTNRVGIGTSSPLYPLHVRADTVGTNSYITFANNGDNAASNMVPYIYSLKGDAFTLHRVDNGSGTDLYWSVGVDQTDKSYHIYNGAGVGLSYLTIMSKTGYTGIGIKTPQNKFHVNSDDGTQFILSVNNSNIGGNQSLEFRYANGLSSAKNARIQVETKSGGGGDMYFDTASSGGTGAYETQMIIKKDGKIGLGTVTPSYPLEINDSNDISLYAQKNISATGFITRTSVYDKSRGSALDLIKDADQLKTNGEINHSKFYGYTSWETPDYSKPLTETDKETDEIITTYPHNITVEGVSLNKEIDVLRQALYELKTQNVLLKTELCSKDMSYSWC